MKERVPGSHTPSTATGPSLEHRDRHRGYTATFHFPDGSRLVVAVADAVGFSCDGGGGDTCLEVVDLRRGCITRANLAALLCKAGIG